MLSLPCLSWIHLYSSPASIISHLDLCLLLIGTPYGSLPYANAFSLKKNNPPRTQIWLLSLLECSHARRGEAQNPGWGPADPAALSSLSFTLSCSFCCSHVGCCSITRIYHPFFFFSAWNLTFCLVSWFLNSPFVELIIVRDTCFRTNLPARLKPCGGRAHLDGGRCRLPGAEHSAPHVVLNKSLGMYK